MSIAEQVKQLEAERDRWKARAEKAEVKVSELECELYAARSIPRQTVADLQLKAELQQALEAAEKRVKELETKLALAEKERDEAKETVGSIQEDYSELESERNRLNRRVQELERQLSSRPSTLEAVLEELREELRGEGIPGSIHVDRYGIHVSVYCVEGLHHTESVQSFHDIPAAMAELVVMHYPDSAFARRRKPAEQTPAIPKTPWMMRLPHDEDPNAVVADADGNIIARVPGSLVELWQNIIAAVNAYKQADPTPNHSETPNSSTDPVADLLKRYPGSGVTTYTP